MLLVRFVLRIPQIYFLKTKKLRSVTWSHIFFMCQTFCNLLCTFIHVTVRYSIRSVCVNWRRTGRSTATSWLRCTSWPWPTQQQQAGKESDSTPLLFYTGVVQRFQCPLWLSPKLQHGYSSGSPPQLQPDPVCIPIHPWKRTQGYPQLAGAQIRWQLLTYFEDKN